LSGIAITLYIHIPIDTQAQQAIAALNRKDIYDRKTFVKQEDNSNGIQISTLA